MSSTQSNFGSFADIGVVVRECGERTANVCYSLLEELLPDASTHRVTGRPFALTLRRALELGVELDLPWTLCIDADVLPSPGLAEFINEARALPSDTFAMQALVIDKLLPSRRPAGNHLYRTENLPLALSLIPSGDVLRPESEMIHHMRSRGHAFHQSRQVVGLHDFEQDHDDIYAKAYLHCHKHQSLMGDYLPIWEVLAETDTDYAVAIDARRRIEGEDQSMPKPCRSHIEALMRADGVVFRKKPPIATFTVAEVLSLMARVAIQDPRIGHWQKRLQGVIDTAVFPKASAPESWSASNFRRLRAWWRASS